MATFIDLHGSFHAARNWHRVIPPLMRLFLCRGKCRLRLIDGPHIFAGTSLKEAA